MGRVGSRFCELGQWYPRMAVYDDVHGWNTLPYLGAGEFYLEYGDFDVSLTVPAGFQIAATGMLANPTMIRTAQERARLAKAFENPGQVVSVITRPEAVANATRKVPGTRTWRFTASGARDFAWATGPDLRWDASTWDGIVVQTFYHADATPWEEANTMVRFALRHFSGTLGQYPWPQVSAIEGLIEGMEYPMVIFCPSLQKREDQYWVLMHELGHQWFPMQVGSDERRWKGKHPQPADFFRTMSNETGRDLDWFWRGWIYTTARLDQAVDSVRAGRDSTFLYLSNRGQMVLPVTVELRYDDGTTETRNLPVEMWDLGSRFTYRMVTTKRLAGVVIDPRRFYPDIDRQNNAWKR